MVTKLAGHEKAAHDQRGGGEQLAGVADAALGAPGVSRGVPLTSGITATPVSKPERPERQPGEDEQRDRHHHDGTAVLGEERLPPVAEHTRVAATCCRLTADDDGVQARGRR